MILKQSLHESRLPADGKIQASLSDHYSVLGTVVKPNMVSAVSDDERSN